MDDHEDHRPASPAADRTITILETLVNAGEPMTLTALAKTTGIPLASAATIAQTLERRGYAARRVVGRSHYWYPTLQLYGLGVKLMRGVDLARVVQPYLRRISDELGVPAHFGVLQGSSVIYLAKAAPPAMVQFNTFVGKVSPFHLTALGRAVAAHLDPDQLAPLLDHLTKGRGPNARDVDRRGFVDRLAEVRVRGYAVEDEEEEPQIGCVAVPVFDAGEQVVGAIGVTGFAQDVVHDRFDQVLAALRKECANLSAHLGFSG